MFLPPSYDQCIREHHHCDHLNTCAILLQENEDPPTYSDTVQHDVQQQIWLGGGVAVSTLSLNELTSSSNSANSNYIIDNNNAFSVVDGLSETACSSLTASSSSTSQQQAANWSSVSLTVCSFALNVLRVTLLVTLVTAFVVLLTKFIIETLQNVHGHTSVQNVLVLCLSIGLMPLGVWLLVKLGCSKSTAHHNN